jgi:hypothetical protein
MERSGLTEVMSFEIPPSLVTALRPTRHIAVLTGAGVSRYLSNAI